ncbi:MAG: OmpA family protein [Bacteroidales bacterium]|nr:OmpA family protein [Bacteroidales bacterium]
MKRSFITIAITAILSMLVSKGVSAECSKHEFSVHAGGGLSSLNYNVTFGEQNLRLGGHFGLGYHFFFLPNWAIGTGIELGFYRSKFHMDNLNLSFMTTDIQGVEFEFRSIINNFEEKQRAMLLQIPLMLKFQTGDSSGRHRFFAAAGGKIGIPIRGRYSNTLPFDNAGYFAFENALYNTQTFMGFGQFPNRRQESHLNFKTAFFLSAEAGVKWRLSDGRWLYTGLYLDYGLNNILKAPSPRPTLVQYNAAVPTAFAVNSVLHSQYMQTAANTAQTFTEKVNPVAIGIKLRLGLSKRCNRNEQAQALVAEQPIRPDIADNRNCDELQKALDETRKALEESETARELTEQELEDTKNALRNAEEKTKAAVIRFLEMPIDHYALNQTAPHEYQKRRLDEKIVILKQYPDLKFYIQGHTCDIGTTSANERVGIGRDVGARAYMITNGIDPSRILGIECKRDIQPVVPNTSEANRLLNRRVQLVLIE